MCLPQVPIVTLRLRHGGLECDLSIADPLATLKCQVTGLLMRLDQRALLLYHLVGGGRQAPGARCRGRPLWELAGSRCGVRAWQVLLWGAACTGSRAGWRRAG
jgi:hypothetical protein